MTAIPISPKAPSSFHAQWPQALQPTATSKVTHLFWRVLSVIFFPIYICEAALALLKNRVLRIVVPGNFHIDAPVHSFFDLLSIYVRFLVNPENFKADLTQLGTHQILEQSGRSIQLKTPDGATLDGVFYPGKNKGKAILYAFGNGGQWENQSDKVEYLKQFNASILMFNPRGVGNSSGPSSEPRSEQGYALDAYSAYRYLIDVEGLDPENILLIGFSMGAAYGTCGASLIQEEYPDKKISAISLCSFSDLHLEVQTVLSGFLCTVLRVGTYIINLQLNPKEAWDKLKGEKTIFYRPHDDVIPYEASLCKAVREDPKGPTDIIEMSNHEGHIPPYDNQEFATFNQQVLKMLHLKESETTLPHRSLFNPFYKAPPLLDIQTIQPAS